MSQTPFPAPPAAIDPAQGSRASPGDDIVSQMRLAMRRVAKSVAVITTSHGGTRFAMAATGIDALSLEPPSMIVSVNRSASLHTPLAAGADFCVNILARGHEEISRACSGGRPSGEARFESGQWIEGPGALPVLGDAQASILCRNEVSLAHGTHAIFVGRVFEVRRFGEIDPLIYLDGHYV